MVFSHTAHPKSIKETQTKYLFISDGLPKITVNTEEHQKQIIMQINQYYQHSSNI